MADTGIGAPVRRKEDFRFLKGRGKYTDDIVLNNMTFAAIVRSPHAHATINNIDASAAQAADGVVAVLTSTDFEAFGGLPCGWQVIGKNEEPMIEPKHPILAEGKVRHVGDPVAVVIAESKAQAQAAAELVDIDYSEHAAVINMTQALSDGGSSVHDEAPDNQCYDWEIGDKAAVDAAFDGAHHVTSLELINNRLVPNAMEPRCAIGDFDQATGEHTLYTTSQNPHVIRLLMGAFVLQIPEHKLRVYAPDVGGGFGSKIYHYAEEAIMTVAAPRSGAAR